MGFPKTNRLTLQQLNEKYPGANEALDVGEVNVPGYGWHACVLDMKGNATHFYSEDDGWQEAPRMS